jgi:hypothetical protein
LFLFVLAVTPLSAQILTAAGAPYVVTNDDLAFPFLTGVSFFTVGANGLPVFKQQVQTGTYGIGGGYFGMNRLAVLNVGNQHCVYASEARDGYIVGIAVSSLTVGSSTRGSTTDTGTSNGIGLAMNPNYLYASFSDANTIGTFAVQSGCGLLFIGDTLVSGLAGGIINTSSVDCRSPTAINKTLQRRWHRMAQRMQTRSTSPAMGTTRFLAIPQQRSEWRFPTFPSGATQNRPMRVT